MLPIAHIVHRLRGRLRLKVPDRRGNTGWFEQVASSLRMIPGVIRVEARSASGSLLIHHRADLSLDGPLEDSRMFKIVYGVPSVTLASPERNVFPIGLTRDSPNVGRGDLKKLLIALAVILAMIQALRGKIMAPAISLLIFATNLALMVENSEKEP